MSEMNLHAFPSDEWEALTMLYLQNQNLSGKTPAELVKLYWETYFQISALSAIERKNAKARFSVSEASK